MQVFLVIQERLNHHPGEFRLKKVPRASPYGIEKPVHGHKCPTVATSRWKGSSRGQAAMQSPGEKSRLAYTMKVGQMS